MARDSVTFRGPHRTFIEHPLTVRGVHASPFIPSDLVVRPNQYTENGPDIFRDAEVVGSNPAVPTQNPHVRPLRGGLLVWEGVPSLVTDDDADRGHARG